MRTLKLLLTVAVCLCFAGGVCAGQFSFGSDARTAGMGGACVALSDDPIVAVRVNPAAMAATMTGPRLIIPGLDLRAKGVSLSEVRSRVSELVGVGDTEALSWLTTFAHGRTILDASGFTGMAGSWGVTLEGEAQGIVNPSGTLSSWVNAGQPTSPGGLASAGLIPDSSPASVAGFAAALNNSSDAQGRVVYSLPAVTLGAKLDSSTGRLWFGAKAKWLRGDYRRFALRASSDAAGMQVGVVQTDSRSSAGVSFDLGLLFQPSEVGAQFGLVVQNVINPRLSGIETPVVWSAGTAVVPAEGWVIAADLVNLTRAYKENIDLRIGVEKRFTRDFAVRVGHSGSGYACGFQVGWFGVAFSEETPMMASKVLRLP
jgi:hypothetical protein